MVDFNAWREYVLDFLRRMDHFVLIVSIVYHFVLVLACGVQEQIFVLLMYSLVFQQQAATWYWYSDTYARHFDEQYYT